MLTHCRMRSDNCRRKPPCDLKPPGNLNQGRLLPVRTIPLDAVTTYLLVRTGV